MLEHAPQAFNPSAGADKAAQATVDPVSTSSCVEELDEALARFGKPKSSNTNKAANSSASL